MPGSSSKKREGFGGNSLPPHGRGMAKVCVSPSPEVGLFLRGPCPAGLAGGLACQQSGACGGDY